MDAIERQDPESFVQFEDSTYSTDPIIDLLEDRVLLYISTCTIYSYVSLSLSLSPSPSLSLSQGLQGDEVLVAGVSTGTAKVQVRLVEEVWKV